MKRNNNKKGKEVTVENGHPASFRNANGSMRNIYTDDGNLTEEGKAIIEAREALSKENHVEEKINKERNRNRKLITWSILAALIIFFLLFFHVYISSDGGVDVFAKSTPTFIHTFITAHDAEDVIKRINNASSLFEQTSIRNEPYVKRLYDRGILYTIEDYNEEDYYLSLGGEMIKKDKHEKPQSNTVNDERTEYYQYYMYQTYDGSTIYWKDLYARIDFGKKEIKVVTSEKIDIFIIVGNPKSKYNEYAGDYDTIYNVYRSNDANKKGISIRKSIFDGGEVMINDDNNKSSELFTNLNYR